MLARLGCSRARDARIAARVVCEVFRRLAPDRLLQMPAQVGEQDLAVPVAIGGAAADPVDDDARERAHHVAAGVGVALARGLQPGRGGEDVQALRVPHQRELVVDAAAKLLADRAAEAAIEQQHDAAGLALRDQLLELRDRDRCGTQRGGARFRGREAEPAAGVELAVAGVEQQHEVVGFRGVQNLVDDRQHRVLARVDELLHLEAAAVGILKHGGERRDVVGRPLQRRELGLRVEAPVADEDGDPARHPGLTPSRAWRRRAPPQSRRR